MPQPPLPPSADSDTPLDVEACERRAVGDGERGMRRPVPPHLSPHPHAADCLGAGKAFRDSASLARRTAEALREWADAADEVAEHWNAIAVSAKPADVPAAGRVCAAARAAVVMDLSTVRGLYDGRRDRIGHAAVLSALAAEAAGIRFDLDVGKAAIAAALRSRGGAGDGHVGAMSRPGGAVAANAGVSPGGD